MFSKIVVALNELPESQHALRTAIELARAGDAELATVSILGDPPAYTSFAVVFDAGAPGMIQDARRRAHDELHEKALKLAQEYWVRAKGSIVEGREVQAILHFLKDGRADLFVIGLHQTTFIYPAFGVLYMTSHKKLPAVCSVCIEHLAQEQRGISVEIGLGSEALRHE